MKTFILLGLIISLSGCAWVAGTIGDGAKRPVSPTSRGLFSDPMAGPPDFDATNTLVEEPPTPVPIEEIRLANLSRVPPPAEPTGVAVVAASPYYHERDPRMATWEHLHSEKAAAMRDARRKMMQDRLHRLYIEAGTNHWAWQAYMQLRTDTNYLEQAYP